MAPSSPVGIGFGSVAVLLASAQIVPTMGDEVPTGDDGAIDFWLDVERELDVVVTCSGYEPVRVTVTTDSASGGGGGGSGTTGVDSALRTYVQHIMGQIDPTGPPPP